MQSEKFRRLNRIYEDTQEKYFDDECEEYTPEGKKIITEKDFNHKNAMKKIYTGKELNPDEYYIISEFELNDPS